MTSPGWTPPATGAELRAGTGERVRREFGLRAAVAGMLGVAFLGVAAYGGYGVATATAIGVPFLVVGLAGALAQFALAAALRSARSAVTGDRYDRPRVTRTRRRVTAVLIVLAGGAVVALIAGTVTLGAGLGGLMALGLALAFAITADGWRVLHHLG